MGVDDEFGIDVLKAAAIADYFRAADRNGPENFNDRIARYIDTFGAINFAALEMIFRENKFNTYLIAIPASFIQEQNPDVITVDINDMQIRNIISPVPFVVGFSSSENAAKQTAEECGFVYNTQENLQNLRRTGVCVNKEMVGLTKPIYHLGLRVRPLRGQPKGDPRQAQWN